MLCTIGAVAVHFFCMLHIGKDDVDFSTRRAWYDKHLYHGNSSSSGTSYSAHNNMIIAALVMAGITSKKTTHAGRGSGARNLANKG